MPKSKKKPVFYMLFFTGLILLFILFLQPLEIILFEKNISVLFPKGLIALEERNLLLIIQGIMLLVIIPVYILTFVFSWKYRADRKDSKYDPDLVDHIGAEFIWWGLPIVIVAVIATLTWIKTHELDPFKPIASDKKALTIEVVALQWKWLFIYPEQNIATINYLQIPKDRPIRFVITADAPMNSFWLPDLGGQIYAMPGMKTELNLIADKTGEFRGSSANISGEGFSGMTFIAHATSEEDFKNWVNNSQAEPKTLNWNEYKKIALPSKDSPVATYRLVDNKLFMQILMKFMEPEKSE